MSSWSLAYRSFGSFWRSFTTIAFIPAGTFEFTSRGGRSCPFTCFIAMPMGVSASYGSFPVSIS